MDKLVIDRKIWLRGREAFKNSQLLRNDNKRCCVGIYLGQCGVKDKFLKGQDYAIGVPASKLPDEAKWLIDFSDYLNSDDAHRLYQINDQPEMSEKMREYLVKRKFKKYGIAVEFIN